MPPPFRQVNRAQFAQIVGQFNFRRRITAVHFHHTSVPNHSQFQGHASVVAMFRHHTQVRNFSDIAQHITIAPDGTIWLGRNWNQPPASSRSRNGSPTAGPFMFETVGNFNAGRDPFRDPQRRTVLTVIALVQRRAGLPATALNFHREFTQTDCPGSTLNKNAIIQAVTQLGPAPSGDELDPLDPAALEADLSDEERAAGAGDGPFDLEAVLRDMETSAPAADEMGDEATSDEEDTHDFVLDETSAAGSE